MEEHYRGVAIGTSKISGTGQGCECGLRRGSPLVCRVMCFASSRARCALHKEIILLNEESVSGMHSGRASLRSLPRVFEKVSRPLNCHLNCFGGIYIIHIYINGHQP